ncbi:MAG: DUF1203 domain-containing protein [Alphaproteobacteria bacterium]|nr:DUF1203 domain-containing protein [Alphaproteobacteria bacterium]
MTALKIIAMPTEQARAYQRGEPDANGIAPEKEISTGPGNPCRHCLDTIEAGAEKLVLAYRPFEELQPYAELGPIFLHGRECDRHQEDAGLPTMFGRWKTVLVRGYGVDDRIQYQAAKHVPVEDLEAECVEMLADENVTYLHIRTSQYNCYQCRVERA